MAKNSQKKSQNSRSKTQDGALSDEMLALEEELAAEVEVNKEELNDFERRILAHLKHSLGKSKENATPSDWYAATALTTRDLMVETWMDSTHAANQSDSKRIYYLSLEFLIGRSLENNLLATGAYDNCRAALRKIGVDYDAVINAEPEAALGNGGLGRLAACFLDSMATLGIPGDGYGIHYHHGMFRQVIEDGRQLEVPENWLVKGNPWEFRRPEVSYDIQFGGYVEQWRDTTGQLRSRWESTEEVTATAVDFPVPGFGGFTANSIRLWSAKASKGFDLQHFNRGEYLESVLHEVESERLSRVLYPDDSTSQGKALRFKQEYFFAAASVADILQRFSTQHAKDWKRLPKKVAIQLNDTHPVLAIPEMMRVLMDDHNVSWDTAWSICTGVFSYTNHTLLPEALETWPVDLFQMMLPRHLQIVFEINRRFLEDVRHRYPGDEGLVTRVSLIDESHGRRVRMAHLAFVSSHSVNGVARIHTELMKSGIFADFHRLFPDRINNKTNGITPRRWLNQANRPLARLITEKVGNEWQTNLENLRALLAHSEEPEFLAHFAAAKRLNKRRLAEYVHKTLNLDIAIDPDTLFDVQVKRIHEYKRQLLNIMHVITRYNRIRNGLLTDPVPRTVIFGGKAAPAYFMAKLIIRLILAVADTINNDRRVNSVLKVLFVPNYHVSSAQVIIPAADLSEQISTAGTEASGTSNMKFALNGALTIGTRDGANIEIAEEVGEENVFFFGLSAAEANARLAQGTHNPWDYYMRNPELSETMDMIRSGFFNPHESGLFRPIYDSLTAGGDRFLLLADYEDYVATQDRVDAAYRDQTSWITKAIYNTARMGKFSSDLTIIEYAREIWGVNAESPAALSLEKMY